jgi:hypothetical protein
MQPDNGGADLFSYITCQQSAISTTSSGVKKCQSPMFGLSAS